MSDSSKLSLFGSGEFLVRRNNYEGRSQISPWLLRKCIFFGDAVEINVQLNDLRLFLEKGCKIAEELDIENKQLENDLDVDNIYDFMNVFSMSEIHLKSFLISLAIVLESGLRGYCKLLKKFNQVEINMNDLKGNMLERFIIYVEKIAKLNINMTPNEKNNLFGFIELRNCLVHHFGELSSFSKRTKVENFYRTYLKTDLREQNVTISKETCLQCLTLIQSFFDRIFEVALEKFPKVDFDKGKL